MKYIKLFENNIELKPSDFAKISPMNCIFKKGEYEIVAQNIMVILSRTGNEFRHMSWIEYKKERMKDGNFSENEKSYFDIVVRYCAFPGNAKQFSKSWNIKAESEIDAEKYNL